MFKCRTKDCHFIVCSPAWTVAVESVEMKFHNWLNLRLGFFYSRWSNCNEFMHKIIESLAAYLLGSVHYLWLGGGDGLAKLIGGENIAPLPSPCDLISPGCPRPNSALTVHKSGLKHRSSLPLWGHGGKSLLLSVLLAASNTSAKRPFAKICWFAVFRFILSGYRGRPLAHLVARWAAE